LATLAARLLAALLALLAALTGLLARLLLPAALLLTRLTWLWIVLLLLVTIRVLVLLRHFLLLGGFSARPKPMLGGRRPFRMEQGPLCGEFATRT
jgi:hypothetical protein